MTGRTIGAGAGGVAAVALLASVLSTEGAFAVLFGWAYFLVRVVPRVAPDGATVAVGAAALVSFTTGIHWLCGAWWRSSDRAAPGSSWKFRWTGSVVAAVVVLFAAGVSLVGVVHQIGWLVGSNDAMFADGIKHATSRESSARHVLLGTSGYGGSFGSVPPGGTFASDGTPLHSWETHLLPYLAVSSAEIATDRPWNGPENARYFRCVVPMFVNSGLRVPRLEDREGFGLSHYAANNWVMGANRGTKLSDITDGAAATLMIGEVNTGFRPWGDPVNWRDPSAGLNVSPAGFGGPSGSGNVIFVMADGSVRLVSDRVSPDVLRGLATPRGAR